jgi:hypothetical protein
MPLRRLALVTSPAKTLLLAPAAIGRRDLKIVESRAISVAGHEIVSAGARCLPPVFRPRQRQLTAQ